MTQNNAINNGMVGIGFGAMMTNVKFPRAAISNSSAATDTDIYTCPAGKRAALIGMAAYNNNGSTSTVNWKVKISGTYYRLFNNNFATLTSGAAANQCPYILEGGETIAFNSSVANLNVSCGIVEYDNTSGPKTVRLLSFASGNNTLYTCPAGKTAMLLGSNLDFEQTNQGSTYPRLWYANDSGGTVTIVWNLVPNGSAVATANRSYQSTLVTTGASLGIAQGNTTFNGCFGSGDFMNINVSSATATQQAWINVVEI